MNEESPDAIQEIRGRWRERLRNASIRAKKQVDGMGIADLRALRETIREELDALASKLPDPVPLEVRGPMAAEDQANHLREALKYNALKVREQVVSYELRRRALGPEVEVPSKTKKLAEIAWKVMDRADAQTVSDVYQEVARQADEEVHLTTVEKWLRHENPHHAEEKNGSWKELRRAVLLASTSF